MWAVIFELDCLATYSSSSNFLFHHYLPYYFTCQMTIAFRESKLNYLCYRSSVNSTASYTVPVTWLHARTEQCTNVSPQRARPPRHFSPAFVSPLPAQPHSTWPRQQISQAPVRWRAIPELHCWQIAVQTFRINFFPLKLLRSPPYAPYHYNRLRDIEVKRKLLLVSYE